MAVSSAFFAWREAEQASLDAQTALCGAHIDHWIGAAPAPDPVAVDRACKLQARAHELFLDLMSYMQAAARVRRPAWDRSDEAYSPSSQSSASARVPKPM